MGCTSSHLDNPDIYTPFEPGSGQFRILILEAARDSNEVQGTLKIVSLRGKPRPQYETISYVWGKASRTESMILNGQRIYVPRSSVQALRRIQLLNSARAVWIDAICINQKDLVERARQVRLMGPIYARSQGNLIYLSEGGELYRKRWTSFRPSTTASC